VLHKIAALIAGIAGFLRQTATAVVLLDELAKNRAKCCQVLEMSPENSVFLEVISALGS
jgi:hypothetical protein